MTDLAGETAKGVAGGARRRAPPPEDTAMAPAGSGRLAIPVILLIVSMLVPFIFVIGPLRLSPNRLVLLVMVLPCLYMLVSGKAGRIRTPDIALLLLWAWSAIAMIVNHGLIEKFEAMGIFFVETLGAYLLGRVMIRDAESFRKMVQLLFASVVVLGPLVISETILGRNLLRDAVDMIGTTYGYANLAPRLGLNRAQGTFAHPILLGVYCGTVIALAYYVLGYGKVGLAKAWRALVALFTAATCLSSGPLAAMTGQTGMIAWDIVFHKDPKRWWRLAAFYAFCWVFVDILSNRTPPEVFITYFALNEATAWNRIAIWIHGSASVLNHPFFGVGFGDWDRPSWMSDSMDMYWLVVAVRYGLPGIAMMALAFLWIFLKVALRRWLDPRHNAYRLGFLGCMLGYFLVGWTVHFWNETYVMFLFMLGSGVWLLDVEATEAPAAEPAGRAKRRRGVTRNSDAATAAGGTAPEGTARARPRARAHLGRRDQTARRGGRPR